MQTLSGFKRLGVKPLSPERPFPKPLTMSKDGGSSGRLADTTRQFILEDTMLLDKWGPVHVTLTATELTWEQATVSIPSALSSSVLSCCGRGKVAKRRSIPLSEVVTAELLEPGPLSAPTKLGGVLACGAQQCLGPSPPMQRWMVHHVDRTNDNTGRWTLVPLVLGHSDPAVCAAWKDHIFNIMQEDRRRPKSLLVLVNPFGGKGQGVQTWQRVAPLFELAGIKTEVVTTQSVGHAFNVMDQATDEELRQRDGIIVVGGDGLFNEVLNGLLMRRHLAAPAVFPPPAAMTPRPLLEGGAITPPSEPCSPPPDGTFSPVEVPPTPEDALLKQKSPVPETETVRKPEKRRTVSWDNSVAPDPAESSDEGGGEGGGSLAERRRLSGLAPLKIEVPESTPLEASVEAMKRWQSFGKRVRVGIIPAGSTDTVVVSTVGARDPVTCALHIVIGDRLPLDIVRITSWDEEHKGGHQIGLKSPIAGGGNAGVSMGMPKVRYAASMAGYGFYGDVMRDSEAYRWMGPARYDWAGFRTFMKHKSYQAEITFLESRNASTPHPHHKVRRHHSRKKKSVCLVDCPTCASAGKKEAAKKARAIATLGAPGGQPPQRPQLGGQQSPPPQAGDDLIWRTVKGNFHSVAGAVMTCRNDKAPAGLSAHAHLSDGCLDLILVKECTRAQYLQQLLRLARSADSADLKFVEAHKTPAFHFNSVGNERSTWNIDGELLTASQMSAEVFHGLVDIFARGPEI